MQKKYIYKKRRIGVIFAYFCCKSSAKKFVKIIAGLQICGGTILSPECRVRKIYKYSAFSKIKQENMFFEICFSG